MVFSRTATVLVFIYYLASCACSCRDETLYFKEPCSGQETVDIDDSSGVVRAFEGIGAISGGGATSKLLVNYPEKERNEILDYLFKPGFGASLQIFKVEIGGDMQSTDGTEASHMHYSWEENYHRGYEWWLLKEAKKRNPNIKLYCLTWGFPGWIGKGTNNPYIDPELTADYIVRWIRGAKTIHNLTMDYVGIWNERPYNIKYIKTLRQTLDHNGFQNTLIVAPDDFGWNLAHDIKNDEHLEKIVHAIGAHYPGTQSADYARNTRKPLWASEDYSTFNDVVGGGCWARTLNQNYVNGLMTATISWNLIGSYYPNLPFPRNGLMTAMEPWSGHYVVETPIWVTAHTTQFVPLGWRYLRHHKGVAKLSKGGSHVALTNDARDQLTIVIETMSHDHSICVRPKLPPYEVSPQTITLTLSGSFKKISKLNVWYSKLIFNGSESQMFMKRDPLVFTNGQAQLCLGVDEIYTLTTLNTGEKGVHPKPRDPSPFPLNVHDNFTTYEEYQEPFNLAPQIGSYEVRKINGESVLRQTVLQRPVYWCKSETLGKTMSIIGNHSWTQMGISAVVEIPRVNGTDGVFVAARVDRGGCYSNEAQGIFFFTFPITGKLMVTNDLARTKVLYQGTVPMTSGKHEMNLTVTESKAQGYYDQRQVFSLDLPETPKNGWVALGTDSYGLADFHSYTVKVPQEASEDILSSKIKLHY
ncbi:galactocerebrosidase [Elysia marginata]|uniref:galactosylceramidase n=1 Tax=Elysia marginata TaxID=1093978 RepID=A0AAV4GJP5_9GAST|nr:galactocerebrosidase [Elysia marginata]